MKPEEILPQYKEFVAANVLSVLDPRSAKEFWFNIKGFLEPSPVVLTQDEILALEQDSRDADVVTEAARYAGGIIAGDPQFLADWQRDLSPVDAKERAKRYAIGVRHLFGNIALGLQMGAEAAQMSPGQSERMIQRVALELALMVGAGGRPIGEQQQLFHVLTERFLTSPLGAMARYAGALSEVGGAAYPTITSLLQEGMGHVAESFKRLSRHQSGTKSLELVQETLPLGPEVSALMVAMGRMEKFGNPVVCTVERNGKKDDVPIETSVRRATGFLYGDYGELQRHPITNEVQYEVMIKGRPETRTLTQLRKEKWTDDDIMVQASPHLDFDPLKPETSPMVTEKEQSVGCIRPGERLAVKGGLMARDIGSTDYRNYLLAKAGIKPEEISEFNLLDATGRKLDKKNPLVSGMKDPKERGIWMGIQALSVITSKYREIALQLHVILGSGVSFDPAYLGENAFDALVKALKFDAYMRRYDLGYQALRELVTGLFPTLPGNKPAWIPEWAAIEGKIDPDWHLVHRNPLSPSDAPILKPLKNISEPLKNISARARAELLDVFFSHRPWRTMLQHEQIGMNSLVGLAEQGASEEALVTLAHVRRATRVQAIMDGNVTEAREIRSRQQMWAMASQLPKESREAIKDVDWTDYLRSMGVDVDKLDPAECKGILGLYQAINIHDWDQVRWDLKDMAFVKFWKYLNDHAEHIQTLVKIGSALIQSIDPSIAQKLGMDPDFIKAMAASRGVVDRTKLLITHIVVDQWLEGQFRTQKVLHEYVKTLAEGVLKSGDVSFVGPMGQRELLLDTVLYIDRIMNGYVAPILYEGATGRLKKKGTTPKEDEYDTMGEHGTKRNLLKVDKSKPFYSPLRKALLAAGDHLVENGKHTPYVTTGDGVPAYQAWMDKGKLVRGLVHPLVPYGHRGDVPEAAITFVLNILEDAGVVARGDTQMLQGILVQTARNRIEALKEAGISSENAQYKYLIQL